MWSGLRRVTTMLQPNGTFKPAILRTTNPDPPCGPSPLQMEYRNKFYVVVRSRASAGWDWAVDVDARTVRSGQAVSEGAAIKAAERLIDRALAPMKRKLTLVGPSRDGRP